MTEFEFGERLTALRKARGLTKARLASLIGVTDRIVRGWESSKTEPRRSEQIALTEILGVTPAYLWLGTACATPETSPSAPEDILADAVLRIASAAGVDPANVTISLNPKSKTQEVKPLQAPRPNLENDFRVYRSDHNCPGWRATKSVAWKRDTKFFRDGAFSSSSEAKDAAACYIRQNAELQHELLRIIRSLKPRTNSRSGIPGVTRVERGEKRKPCWMAYWTEAEHGRRISKRFTVSHRGEEEAFRLAVAAREAGVSKLRERLSELATLLEIPPSALQSIEGLDKSNIGRAATPCPDALGA